MKYSVIRKIYNKLESFQTSFLLVKYVMIIGCMLRTLLISWAFLRDAVHASMASAVVPCAREEELHAFALINSDLV